MGVQPGPPHARVVLAQSFAENLYIGVFSIEGHSHLMGLSSLPVVLSTTHNVLKWVPLFVPETVLVTLMASNIQRA